MNNKIEKANNQKVVVTAIAVEPATIRKLYSEARINTSITIRRLR